MIPERLRAYLINSGYGASDSDSLTNDTIRIFILYSYISNNTIIISLASKHSLYSRLLRYSISIIVKLFLLLLSPSYLNAPRGLYARMLLLSLYSMIMLAPLSTLTQIYWRSSYEDEQVLRFPCLVTTRAQWVRHRQPEGISCHVPLLLL